METFKNCRVDEADRRAGTDTSRSDQRWKGKPGNKFLVPSLQADRHWWEMQKTSLKSGFAIVPRCKADRCKADKCNLSAADALLGGGIWDRHKSLTFLTEWGTLSNTFSCSGEGSPAYMGRTRRCFFIPVRARARACSMSMETTVSTSSCSQSSTGHTVREPAL